MIEFRSASFGFDDVGVLENVSLSIPDGEFVVLAGANGSGKTTLLRHCNGLLSPDEGTVLVDDTPVEDDVIGARTSVGMVFQHPRDQFVAATVLIYAMGVGYMAWLLELELWEAVTVGALPFIPGELLKIAAAVAIVESGRIDTI